MAAFAIGKVLVYKKGEQQVKRYHVTDTAAESQRFEDAKAEAVEQLKALYAKAVKEVGEASAAIFEIHQMMLDDLDYLDSIHNMIETQEVNAEYAVATTSDNFAMMFSSMDDAYMKERAADVKDVSERILAILSGGAKSTVATDEPSIIVADDLAPSETVQLDKDKVLAFVTVHGSSNSHTAILARTMGIPALIGTPVDLESVDGKTAVVDGYAGIFYVDPDEETVKTMEEKRQKDLEQKELLQNLKGKENITLDGQKVMLYANIGNIKDLAMVLQNDAAGIGLFRSEFIYLEKDDYPTEEEQFKIYRAVAETMAGKKVVIRHPGYRSGQAGFLFQYGSRGEPGSGLPRNSYLPDPPGYLQDAAESALPRQRLRQHQHHVPHDHIRGRGEEDQEDRGGGQGGADQPGHRLRETWSRVS